MMLTLVDNLSCFIITMGSKWVQTVAYINNINCDWVVLPSEAASLADSNSDENNLQWAIWPISQMGVCVVSNERYTVIDCLSFSVSRH